MSGVIAATVTTADTLMLIVIFALLLVLVFLAAAEMGLSKMTKPKAAALAEEGGRPGRALTRLVDEPERWVNPLLLTVNICQTVQATLTGIVSGRLFGAWGVAIGVTLNVIVFFVMAEAVPKTYAVIHPERAALRTARPVRALVSFPPLRLVSRALIGLTNVIVRGKGLKQGPFVSEQELLGIVEAAAEDEVIEHEERELIESIIEFGDTVAREVMVPRPDMVIIPNEASISSSLDLAIANGYSRLPVFGPGDSDVIGLAYTKDLIRAEREGRGDLSVLDLVRPVRFIPENKPVSRLMREMQAGKFHLAIVADEYGDVVGLITLEDCLEELVGEIVDEYDIEEHAVERLPNGDYLVDGGISIDELNELLGGDLPNDDWDTLGGLVFSTLEHVPVPGEELQLEHWHFTAEEVEGRRIRLVRVRAFEIVDDRVEHADDDAAHASG
ncbi:MAG: hemolysin family protein [Ilumatobacter sp.]|uniref:hemolysin family protein n=1 Tax=Ilumatobacter sp. TaxID=1967498 RepID=UPI002628FE51|nr:hemolysin family protein [Ilumatobacter sp.]MDJ0771637.1 hemolysin family protein [Ilumatobacter sp.]